jgi:hypothetical protein
VKLDRLITFFASNPSAKLLRAQHAPYVIHFLHQHFKKEGNLSTLHSVLQQRLAAYLETLHETEPQVLREPGETYLNSWSTGESRWLRRYFDAQHSESVYQLTPHTEDVLTFLTEVLDRNLGFVGTESRLSRIIATLSDIVVRGSADPNLRLKYLRDERRRIEEEIRSIEAGHAVERHSPTAIRERFADAVSDLVSLQGDFRAVEESFKTITRDVQKRQAQSLDSRGKILGFALEAEDQLKDQDQGASFQAFVRLILSQSQQDALERTIGQLDEIADLVEQLDGKRRIKGMIGSLSSEAEKVLRVTRRLNATLRRLLDTRASSTRLRLAEVLSEIRALAARHADRPPNIGIDVLSDLELLNVHQRTFWDAPLRFSELQLSNAEQSDDDRLLAFKHLAEMQRLDWNAMRSNIADMAASAERTTLPELLRQHPPDAGAIEVLGYIQLAHDDGHEVNENKFDVVLIEDSAHGETPKRYWAPRVVFLPEGLRARRGDLISGGADNG